MCHWGWDTLGGNDVSWPAAEVTKFVLETDVPKCERPEGFRWIK